MTTELKDLMNTSQSTVVFDDSEIKVLSDISEIVEFGQDQIIFQADDYGDSVYLVATGAVDLYTSLHDNLDQTIMTVRTGGFVGAIAMIEDNARGINARAAEKTVIYRFDRENLHSLITNELGLGVKLLHLLNDILSKRLRIVMESLQQNLTWTMQVAGLANLDISQLIVDRVNLVIELVNGKQLDGIIVKAEEHPSGFELFIKTDDDVIHFLPYHAIVTVSLPLDVIKTNQSESSSL